VFDHVTIGVADRDASEHFYATTLAAIGIEQDRSGPDVAEWSDFSLAQADAERPLTRHLHIGFAAPSREAVDEFWRAGIAAGYRDDGRPGPRQRYREEYYGGFLLDPDGNSAEAVHHDVLRSDGVIDHLWLRVADLAAARRFYSAVAPYARMRLRRDLPERVQFAGTSSAGGSFSLVPSEPLTRHAHMAFAAGEDAAVDAFHRALRGGSYRDNGAPGERPRRHPGYYAAYVLDPDGNSIELVNHNRV
jgi:catechol 2,3-dioxygenase-like lactoylglutathione lyase family enzyme